MPRRLRFHLPSAVYHVILRGNDKQDIFFSNGDRCTMCLLIQEGIEKYGHTVHSFCFMTNHVHLAIQVKEINISKIIQNLAFRYTQYINRKYDRVGHLFQGRFKSIIVDDSQYLKELVRYIHLNPVRANLVNAPEKYVWSSHRAYLQLDEYVWLNYSHVLKKFGSTRNGSITTYRDFIQKGIGSKIALDFNSGLSDGILGDEEFVDKFLESVEGHQMPEIELTELIENVCNYFNLHENNLRAQGKNRLESHARAVLSFLVRESENLSIEKLAKFLNRDPSSLSKLASRLEKKCLQSPAHAIQMKNIKESICNSQMSECQA